MRSPTRRAKRLAATTTTLLAAGAIVMSGMNPAMAEGGSSGTSGPGGSYGSSAGLDVKSIFFDNISPDSTQSEQGTGEASINWFLQRSGLPLNGRTATEFMPEDCRRALDRANQRARDRGEANPTSRVVGMIWATKSGQDEGIYRAAPWFYKEINDWVAAGYPGLYNNSRSHIDSVGMAEPDYVAYLGKAAISSATGTSDEENYGVTMRTVCIALNNTEPVVNYQLTINTDKASTFSLAGETGAVHDVLHASNNGSSIRETVTGNVIMHWDGVEGSPAKQVSKQISITNVGDTKSPEFTPADFGWPAWPSGKFWFDVQVPKQSKMKDAVDTADRDARETWDVKIPPPVKVLTSGDPKDELTDPEVLASGQFYNSEITANSAGYKTMTITDSIGTDKVWIGAREKDDKSKVTVIDPDGNTVDVSKVTTTITREGGKTVVDVKVVDMPDKFQGLTYTAIVPTYVQPTGKDYRVPDEPYVTYPRETRVDGEGKSTEKTTPTPNKAWVLDNAGALVTADPDWKNNVGADNKVFLMNDKVYAVVNGHLPATLADPMYKYQIRDDWSDALAYVNFAYPSLVRVYLDGKDVTSEFKINVDAAKGLTTATAQKAFLDRTKGTGKDRVVKLVIGGAFRNDYDTNGETVRMVNAGSETWNNETMPTNTPPVYTWTPNPEKQVLGASDQDGAKTYANIAGQKVFPGQRLEYSIGLDLRIPEDTALGVKSLAVRDTYDVNFTPDTKSVEIWDSRDATNPKPVAASNYKLTFDKARHQFTVTFTKAWIDANISKDGANNKWLKKGWLTLRFAGTVNPATPTGTTVRNQAFQIINDAETATEIPEVHVPPVEPDKEDLNTAGDNIDGKTVVAGDTIVYRLTLDATPTTEELAYYVHKLGMSDDYDEKYLKVDAKNVRVTNKATGKDVTSKFNIQLKGGKLYVFAKQVDSTLYDGTVVKGDPQPKDLEAYMGADIIQGVTPIIDQNLMGNQYYITFPALVTKETDGYVIKNQAIQNLENVNQVTRVVSNPLKDIDPDKDIVASEETKDTSLDGQEIPMNESFNYRLDSSTIPANRAYKASQWSIVDTFDRVHDQYTGIWAAYANTDLYDGTKLVYKKGDLIADSAAHEGEERSGMFTATFNQDTYTYTITAAPKLLTLVNSRGDKPAGFSVYVKMIRIAPSERVENKATESYNNYDRDTKVVWTHTPEHPSLDVEKYTLDEGAKKGDRDTKDEAYTLTDTQLATKDGKQEGVKVGITITNTGDVPLKDITITDATGKGYYGQVEDLACKAPTALTTDPATTTNSGDKDQVWVDPATITTLAVGQTVDCEGVLRAMQPGMTHTDTITVTGKSIFTGKTVKDEDPWWAKANSNPTIEVVKYTLNEGPEDGDRDDKGQAYNLNAGAAKDGVKVGFDITNTGDEHLTITSITDTTMEGTTGKVEGIQWAIPATSEAKAANPGATTATIEGKEGM